MATLVPEQIDQDLHVLNQQHTEEGSTDSVSIQNLFEKLL
jgi:hypothetical protein